MASSLTKCPRKQCENAPKMRFQSDFGTVKTLRPREWNQGLVKKRGENYSLVPTSKTMFFPTLKNQAFFSGEEVASENGPRILLTSSAVDYTRLEDMMIQGSELRSSNEVPKLEIGFEIEALRARRSSFSLQNGKISRAEMHEIRDVNPKKSFSFESLTERP